PDHSVGANHSAVPGNCTNPWGEPFTLLTPAPTPRDLIDGVQHVVTSVAVRDSRLARSAVVADHDHRSSPPNPTAHFCPDPHGSSQRGGEDDIEVRAGRSVEKVGVTPDCTY